MHEVTAFLTETAQRAFPRMLTQICRDPGAPFYGSCDRNWWHYKIRDFSSIIIQQAGYAMSIAAELPCLNDGCTNSAQPLNQLAAATARFWNQRAIMHGAFEEYYPFEQGYPPVAFSSLAIAKLCHQGIVPLADVRSGLAIAAQQLLNRFEAEAANQQIAGTAALSVIRTLDRSLVDESAFQVQLTRILGLQHAEGWFPEYDGPDLGYLAVSMDCLWDIYDHTQETRVKNAIVLAADYTAWFALNPIGEAGMHNSRNTDYFVPYGLVRLAIEDRCKQTADVVRRLFTRRSADGFHPFDAVDDRYWCHYIGHSVFRALALLDKHSLDSCTQVKPGMAIPSQQAGSGHALLGGNKGPCSLVSTRKGAITTGIWPGGEIACDFGWIVQTPKQLYVSHWWTPAWKITANDRMAGCEGYLVSHKEHLSTPWKHMILRLTSYVFGRRLIKVLKRLVIFKKPQQTLHFSRSVTIDGDAVVLRDRITGLSDRDQISRAPRTSKRHVASADSYHPEDLAVLKGVTRQERINQMNHTFECETRYTTLDSMELS